MSVGGHLLQAEMFLVETLSVNMNNLLRPLTNDVT